MSTYTKPKHIGKIVITKKDPVTGEVQDYLRRWYLFRCKWFSIRLHHIVLPDQDRWPHDHPWNFLAIVLLGGYRELWDRNTAPRPSHPSRSRMVRRLSYHRGEDVHRITRFLPGRYFTCQGAWTLFITGRERRHWGFQTPDGWVPWEEYEDA